MSKVSPFLGGALAGELIFLFMRLLNVTIVSYLSSLDFCLDPAVDNVAVESGYTPLSTGLLFGVFICRLLANAKLLQGKINTKVVAIHQAAFSKGICL